MKDKLAEMFEVQDTLNKKILGDDYAKSGIPFYRAALVEACELMEHRGYKWWKKTDNYDETQAHLEVVDIWHFLMSDIITCEDVDMCVIENAFSSDSGENNNSKEQQLESIDSFIESMSIGINQVDEFCIMMRSFGMSFDSLYEMYVSKNALNLFRQDNGYKDGTYNKTGWVSLKTGELVEDNVVLSEIMEDENTLVKIVKRLEEEYKKCR